MQYEIEEGDTRLTLPVPGTRSPPVLPEGPFTRRPSPLLSQASIKAAAPCRLLSMKYPTDPVSFTEHCATEVANRMKEDVSGGLGTGVSLQAWCGVAALSDCVDSVADNKSLAQHAKVRSPSCMQPQAEVLVSIFIQHPALMAISSNMPTDSVPKVDSPLQTCINPLVVHFDSCADRACAQTLLCDSSNSYSTPCLSAMNCVALAYHNLQALSTTCSQCCTDIQSACS